MQVDSVIWYKSGRVWSALLTLISLILYATGLAPMLTPDQIASYVNVALLALSGIGVVGAGVGQAVATKNIVLTSTDNSVTISVANTNSSNT